MSKSLIQPSHVTETWCVRAATEVFHTMRHHRLTDEHHPRQWKVSLSPHHDGRIDIVLGRAFDGQREPLVEQQFDEDVMQFAQGVGVEPRDNHAKHGQEYLLGFASKEDFLEKLTALLEAKGQENPALVSVLRGKLADIARDARAEPVLPGFGFTQEQVDDRVAVLTEKAHDLFHALRSDGDFDGDAPHSHRWKMNATQHADGSVTLDLSRPSRVLAELTNPGRYDDQEIKEAADRVADFDRQLTKFWAILSKHSASSIAVENTEHGRTLRFDSAEQLENALNGAAKELPPALAAIVIRRFGEIDHLATMPAR